MTKGREKSATHICKHSLIQEQMFSGGIVGGVVEVNQGAVEY